MRNLLQSILITLAQATLRKYKPEIVAVTGNVGKTSTKEAIAIVLKKKKNTRMSGGNLNNELGVPLTILGNWSREYYRQGGTPVFWLEVILVAVWGLLVRREYPEVLILEYGADRPGDIERLTQLFPPHVGVVTAVGEVPVHVEFFTSPQHVAKEKSQLVSSLEPSDHAVLNADDPMVFAMREKTKAKVTTFGFSENTTVKIVNLDTSFDEGDYPRGIAFKISHNGSLMPVRIFGSLGASQAFAASAAAAVGLIYNMNLVEISEALGNYQGAAGRLKILKGIKKSIIIDDTYNASPSAMYMALDTLTSLPKGRKIAVLGSMLELGTYTVDAHTEVGQRAGQIADVIVCVGEKTKFIAEGAQHYLSPDRIFVFHTSDEAKLKVQELIQEGDIVLVKGSQGIRMEKIVEEIMAEPERKGELLVRQSKKWLDKA